MNFLKRYWKLHLWLFCDLVVLGFFYLFRGNRAVMNALSRFVTQPLKETLGFLCSFTTISMAEVMYVTLAGLIVLLLGVGARKLWESHEKRRTLYRMISGTVAVALTIYTALCLLWGVNYRIDSFQDKSGIHARPASAEELGDLTAYFARELNALADQVPRDENGSFAATQEEILAASTSIYEASYEEFPFLRHTDRTPKAFVHSRLLSIMGFAGSYFPFTGETYLNVDCPLVNLPSTIVHELGHQRGFASEQECNFLAVVVAMKSDDPVYRYSGALRGYTHLGNALFRADPERWLAIVKTLPKETILDIVEDNRYWEELQTPTREAIRDASHSTYDSFLKNYGVEEGMKSYGMVVDLLIAYYL